MKNVLSAFAISLFALVSTAQATEKKEWTMLVFINGNNSLDEFGAQNINQMETIGSNKDLNIVVQWASLERGKTQRLLVQKDSDTETVTSPVLEDIGNPDMGDYHTLEAFAKWAVEKYPAKHYFLNVWDHGSGWRYMLRSQSGLPNISDISWDDNTGNAITTKQLGIAIKNISAMMGQKIDVYGSDACLMAMAEVAGEMDGAIDYFVGSQDLEPGAGWPYDKFLSHLGNKPDLSPRDLTIALTEEYSKQYAGSRDVTFSSFDMGKYAPLKASLRSLSAEIIKLPAAGKDKVFAAAKNAQAFEYNDYGDLADFLKLMDASRISTLNPKVVEDASKATTDFVVINRAGAGFPNANGVSVWLPKDKSSLDLYKEKYRDLIFNNDTQWLNALAAFVKR